MKYLELYPDWIEAEYISRPNRFVMLLKHKNSTIKAYVPNTGRMAEFLIPGKLFYLTSLSGSKYRFGIMVAR